MNEHTHPDLLDDALHLIESESGTGQLPGARCPKCDSLAMHECSPDSFFTAECSWCGFMVL